MLLSSGHLLLEEEDEDEEEEDFTVHSWNKCQPGMQSSGSRVFVWGNRACWPACEGTNDRVPETNVQSPTEVPWFAQFAEQNNCKWQQLSFGPSFGVSRTDSGEIYLWGSTLKKDGKGRQYAPPRQLLLKDETETRFKDVQCSESSVWGLTPTGKVIVWEMVPQMISEHLASTPMPRFCSGGRSLNGMKRPVKQMSVGVMHAAFLTEDGQVYCLGRNSYGECGVDPSVQNMASSCRRVSFPKHCHPLLRVECGKSHTVAVGAEGQCLSWGDDSKIQLGLGDTRSAVGEERAWSGSRGFLNMRQSGEAMAPGSAFRGPDGTGSRAASTSQRNYKDFESHQQSKPVFMMDIPLESDRQVHGIPYPPPSDLKCGDDFTLMLVRDSPDWYPPEEESERLFCCGENGKGQCGRSMQQQQQTFAACRLPKNSKIQGFSCGSDHCLAVLRRVGAKKQELWCWGSNACGQAGGNTNGAVCPAARLRLPKGVKVEAAWCGFTSSGVVCSETSRASEAGET